MLRHSKATLTREGREPGLRSSEGSLHDRHRTEQRLTAAMRAGIGAGQRVSFVAAPGCFPRTEAPGFCPRLSQSISPFSKPR